MRVSYKRLWKRLIDFDMKKNELSRISGVSPATLTKMAKGDNVGMDIIVKICTALDCAFDDMMELVRDEPAAHMQNE